MKYTTLRQDRQKLVFDGGRGGVFFMGARKVGIHSKPTYIIAQSLLREWGLSFLFFNAE